MKYRTKITTEPHIARELSEYFTFEVPDAKFITAYIEVKYGMEKYDYSQLIYRTNLFGIVTVHQRIL